MPYDPTLRTVYTHSAVQNIEFSKGMTYSVSENGIVTIRVETKDDEYDEVNIPAALIFEIKNMLNMTQKDKRLVKREYKKRDGE